MTRAEFNAGFDQRMRYILQKQERATRVSNDSAEYASHYQMLECAVTELGDFLWDTVTELTAGAFARTGS